MLPAQRRQVLQQRVIDSVAVIAQCVRRPFQIDGIPQHDGCCHQVEAAGPVALLFKAAVADFAQPVEEHRPGQRVARLALVESGLHTAAQLHTLQPVEDEQRALNVL